MAEGLPPRVREVLSEAERLAQAQGARLYLAGGVVRDLLLERAVLDIDLVAEGDTARLAQALAEATGGRIVVYSQFGTATLALPGLSLDLATARAESYARPGALPAVRPGSIQEDLVRRDFTINAMALSLNREDCGRLLDPCGGLPDLKAGLIRVLHAQSFRDDPTRLWRAVRYAARLDFEIESETLALLRRDLSQVGNVSGDRIFYELECVFGEEYPEKVLAQAGALGLVAELNPTLSGDGWLKQKFVAARARCAPARPPLALYLALWSYYLDEPALAALASYLHLPKALAKTLHDSCSLHTKLKELACPELRPSAVYHLLHGLAPQAILANLLASGSEVVRAHLLLYLDKLRFVRPALTGNDLIRLGLAPGPRLGVLLEGLRDARLDGRLHTALDEEKWLRAAGAIPPASI